MTLLTCSEVEARLDLHAAGEGDETERTALEKHLASCASCRRAHHEARQVLALLDVQFQEPDRLERFERRLDQEERRQRSAPRILRFSRPVASLAAMLLLALGLAGPLPSPVVRPQPAPFAEAPWAVESHASALLAPKSMVARGPGERDEPTLMRGLTVQPAKGSTWSIVSSNEIELRSGRFQVRFDPPYTSGKPSPPLTVKTDAAVLTTRAADFAVTVTSGRAGPKVEAFIQWGQVELRNDLGRSTGQRGEVLEARPREVPRWRGILTP
jgi:hypothetical protein